MSGLDKDSPQNYWVQEPAIAQLVRYKAIQLSRSRGFSRSDQPDIEQELRLELFRKAARFDASRAQATTFARQVIDSKAASLSRLVHAKKRRCGLGTVSMSIPITDGKGRSTELGETLEDSAVRRHVGYRRLCEMELVELRLDVAESNRALPPELKDLAALMGLVSQNAAAGVLGISRRQAAGRLSGLRAHYDQRGLRA